MDFLELIILGDLVAFLVICISIATAVFIADRWGE